MTLPLSNFNGHLQRIVEDLPLAFSWRGNTYTGTKASADVTQTLELGGLEEKVAFILYCRLSDVPGIPEVGEIFIVDGRKMKVLDSRKSPDDGQLLSLAMGWARTELTELGP